MVSMPRKQSVVYQSERTQPVLVPSTMARVAVMSMLRLQDAH
jgi:hypothetical protein